jgi:hypothetical protein
MTIEVRLFDRFELDLGAGPVAAARAGVPAADALHAARGNRASALRTFHTCASVLDRELGARPTGRRTGPGWSS